MFLNEWNCSETKGKNCVGQLNLFKPRLEDRLIDYWVVTLLALVERHVLISKVRWEKIAAGVASGQQHFVLSLN